ncbi:MAG TPA: hypothetical protein VJ742_12940 [Nitrososphaera sp.]|nr:hypothetical protein [Nitrososphaera sp.]
METEDHLEAETDPDDDNVDDFDVRQAFTHPQQLTRFEKVLDELGVTDPFFRHTIIRAKEMESISGDADPIVADGAAEVTYNLVALFADFKANPGKAVISAIKGMDSREEQLRTIETTRTWLNELEVHLLEQGEY